MMESLVGLPSKMMSDVILAEGVPEGVDTSCQSSAATDDSLL
jgi:hypothetical protein